jgi:hypothetical protein
MIIPVNLTQFPKAVRERMRAIWSDENQVAMMQARIRQEKIARFYQDNAPRWKDGFGEMVMAMDPYWMSYFQLERGMEAGEKEFQEWVMKEEPMFRVKAVSPRTTVRVTGKVRTTKVEGRSEPKREVKYRKVYGAG